MSNRLRRGALVLALVLPALPAFAQTAAPSAEGLRLARELATKTEGDRASMLQSLGGPLVGMMQQMGVPQADRAQVLVQEVVLPILSSRYDDLLAIQAKSYASVLSVDDMKGALAFYNTPAGQNLIRAQPQLAQLKLTGMTQWIGALQPELQTRIQQTLKARGWDKG